VSLELAVIADSMWKLEKYAASKIILKFRKILQPPYQLVNSTRPAKHSVDNWKT
jgi:hypothetical protein